MRQCTSILIEIYFDETSLLEQILTVGKPSVINVDYIPQSALGKQEIENQTPRSQLRPMKYGRG
jgi:hypothetical protein